MPWSWTRLRAYSRHRRRIARRRSTHANIALSIPEALPSLRGRPARVKDGRPQGRRPEIEASALPTARLRRRTPSSSPARQADAIIFPCVMLTNSMSSEGGEGDESTWKADDDPATASTGRLDHRHPGGRGATQRPCESISSGRRGAGLWATLGRPAKQAGAVYGLPAEARDCLSRSRRRAPNPRDPRARLSRRAA